jgi:putative ABC transport system permease protein
MRRLRRVPPDKDNDFELSSPDFLSNLWNQLTGALVILTTVISSIGLLVGGIGVMNIMLVSVTERTREIGIRMAIGAREGDILTQFLVEAVVLALLGGLAGAGIGVAAIATLSAVLDWHMSLSSVALTLSVGVSGLTGIAFGFLPALRAATLDPIDALRHE